jgi:hypothetical protein
MVRTGDEDLVMSDVDALVRSMTLVIDNNDSGRYFAVTEAAQRAVVEALTPAPTLAEYEEVYRQGEKHEEHYAYVRAVGAAVADLLAEWLDELAMDEWWKTILAEVLSLESSDIRDALGEHYMPEPDEMRELLDASSEDND